MYLSDFLPSEAVHIHMCVSACAYTSAYTVCFTIVGAIVGVKPAVVQ